MNTRLIALALLLTAPWFAPLRAADEPIDMARAQQLHNRAVRGEKLTPEEQAYYDRAKAARSKGGQKQIAKKAAPPKWTTHLTPLTELGDAKYKGQDGGLYGGGRNDPPKLHLEAAMKEAAKIQPLDTDGQPSADGKIVLLCVGMSNTTMEFSRFKEIADADPAKSSRVILVDGAQSGQDARKTSDPAYVYWKKIDERIEKAGVTAKQVQAIWFKQAIIEPHEEFPAEAKRLQDYTATIMNIIKTRYPNARICYMSSRTYGGYATSALNPEPFAYEDGFGVRWLIQDQIKGEAKLNYDPARGEVKAPLLLWGPYLWADGTTPRKADGFTYTIDDVVERDRTHPNKSGQQKVAELLLKYLKAEPTAKGWFLGSAATAAR
ncbi:MAG: hypothetical protein HY301_04720 [Verrucomicrobia bacterium]|nr:hypothetical protein [Verrucomicrobiota bacterium]